MDMKEEDKTYVFQTADPVSHSLLKQYAEENKLFMTEAERVLWKLLKAKGIGVKFRRQHVIGNYIADFANLHYKLIVEVDGKYHFKGDQPIADEERTAELNQMGYTVVRLTNEEIMGNPQKVLHQLEGIIRNMEIHYGKPVSHPQAPSGNGQGQAPEREGKACAAPSSPPGRGLGREATGWRANAWAVDAACSGNPGPMEYRAIDLSTGAEVFHFGPIEGTNNIGEFLAIVHALALMDKEGIRDKAIYSDSYNAILWVSKKQCKTKLRRDAQTEPVYRIIARAEQWLRTHQVTTPVLKWETRKWGEVPADFGRKS